MYLIVFGNKETKIPLHTKRGRKEIRVAKDFLQKANDDDGNKFEYEVEGIT